MAINYIRKIKEVMDKIVFDETVDEKTAYNAKFAVELEMRKLMEKIEEDAGNGLWRRLKTQNETIKKFEEKVLLLDTKYNQLTEDYNKLKITSMKNVDGIIPTEPIELNFELPEDVEQELQRRETEDFYLLLDELNTI